MPLARHRHLRLGRFGPARSGRAVWAGMGGHVRQERLGPVRTDTFGPGGFGRHVRQGQLGRNERDPSGTRLSRNGNAHRQLHRCGPLRPIGRPQPSLATRSGSRRRAQLESRPLRAPVALSAISGHTLRRSPSARAAWAGMFGKSGLGPSGRIRSARAVLGRHVRQERLGPVRADTFGTFGKSSLGTSSARAAWARPGSRRRAQLESHPLRASAISVSPARARAQEMARPRPGGHIWPGRFRPARSAREGWAPSGWTHLARAVSGSTFVRQRVRVAGPPLPSPSPTSGHESNTSRAPCRTCRPKPPEPNVSTRTGPSPSLAERAGQNRPSQTCPPGRARAAVAEGVPLLNAPARDTDHLEERAARAPRSAVPRLSVWVFSMAGWFVLKIGEDVWRGWICQIRVVSHAAAIVRAINIIAVARSSDTRPADTTWLRCPHKHIAKNS